MIQPTYHFSRIHHPLIFAHSLLIGLTPLIPIPFLDDWVKSSFQRRMVRQITAAYGVPLANEEIEILLQEDFWDSCVGGCVMAFFSLLRRVFRKIIFIFEIRRGLDMFSQSYYNGFLLEAALMDGYNFDSPPNATAPGATAPGAAAHGAASPHPASAEDPQPAVDQTAAAAQAPSVPPSQAEVRAASLRRLREAIRRARYAANFKYIQRILRETVRPWALLKAGGLVVRGALAQLPGLLAAAPRAYWRSVRHTPRRIQEGVDSTFRTVRGIPGQVAASWQRARADFYARIQALLSGEKLVGGSIIEPMSKALEAALLRLPSDHFDALRARLAEELKME